MVSSLADNYLFLQGVIEQRLAAVFADDANKVPIEGVESLIAAGESEKRPVVIHVIYGGDAVPDSDSQRAGRGASQLVDQRWLASLYLTALQGTDRAARNAKAGQYLMRIHKALAGWQPDGQARAFRRIGSPQPSHTKANSMYPLGFAITLNL